VSNTASRFYKYKGDPVPSLIFDLDGIDMTKVQYDTAAVEKINPHRGEMRLLDGIIYMSENYDRAVAYKDVGHNEFWIPGHIPGRPIFPGVLMIEAGAQLASFVTLSRLKNEPFMGFVGCDEIRFRSSVFPGDRLIIMGLQIEERRRRITCNVQGLVGDRVIFDGRIIGMPM
jgi:3-hydroxyacyl-[acyl-carrier-protein] dehydratase